MSASGFSLTDNAKWVDLNPDTRFRNFPPFMILKASDASTDEWLEALKGDDFQPGMVRKVIYEYTESDKHYMELTLFKMPTGAIDVTLGSWSGSTFTSSTKGKLILETGVLTTNEPDADDIAGALLSHYTQTTSLVGSPSDTQPNWEATLEEGDYIWLVRKGRVSLRIDASVTDGDRIIADNSNGVDGCIRPSAAMAGPTAAQIIENIPLYGKCIGVAKETQVLAGTEFAEVWLNLPDRMSL